MKAYALGWSPQDIRRRCFEAQSGLSESSRDQKHEQDLDGSELEDRHAALVLVREADEKGGDEGDVGGEDVQHELLYIIEDTTALFHRIEDASKVIVAQDDVGC